MFLGLCDFSKFSDFPDRFPAAPLVKMGAMGRLWLRRERRRVTPQGRLGILFAISGTTLRQIAVHGLTT
jgi:hypothetical protein